LEAKTSDNVKRIAILGARGQLGSVLCQKLQLHQGVEILALSRVDKPGFLRFNPFSSDWNSLGKIDVFINAAGILRESKNEAFFEVHT
jgi:dTDP-4-dehydrorhamnose reductase